MSNKTIRTELRGYPIHYDELADILNDAMNNLRKANLEIKNSLLEKIGRSVSHYVKYITHPITSNNEAGFGALEYLVGKAKVAILFPWAQDWNNPVSTADSSISIYSTERVGYKKIKSLVEKIAHQVEIIY